MDYSAFIKELEDEQVALKARMKDISELVSLLHKITKIDPNDSNIAFRKNPRSPISDSVTARVQKLIAETPNRTWIIAEIVKELDLDENSRKEDARIRAALTRGVKAGKIELVSRGIYRAVSPKISTVTFINTTPDPPPTMTFTPPEITNEETSNSR